MRKTCVSFLREGSWREAVRWIRYWWRFSLVRRGRWREAGVEEGDLILVRWERGCAPVSVAGKIVMQDVSAGLVDGVYEVRALRSPMKDRIPVVKVAELHRNDASRLITSEVLVGGFGSKDEYRLLVPARPRCRISGPVSRLIAALRLVVS